MNSEDDKAANLVKFAFFIAFVLLPTISFIGAKIPRHALADSLTVIFNVGIGIGLIIASFRLKFSRLHLILIGYFGLAVSFAGIYYIIYKRDRLAFVFSDEIRDISKVAAAKEEKEYLKTALEELQFLDTLLLIANRHPSEFGQREIAIPVFPSRTVLNLGEFYKLEFYAILNPAKAKSDQPPFKSSVEIKCLKPPLTEALPITERKYDLSNDDYSPPHLTGTDVLKRLHLRRVEFTTAVEDYYVRGTATAEPFRIFDFYYFAFTIVGGGDISAAKTSIRLLVVLHILCLAALVELADQVTKAR